MTKKKIINSSMEVGLRTLIILEAIKPNNIELDKLIIFDYLIVHSKDAGFNTKSLHPSTPYRVGEIFVRRQLVQEGLNLMESRELITKRYSPSGITYEASSLTAPFISYLESEYSRKIKENALLIENKFKDFSLSELKLFVMDNLDFWGGEFLEESLLRRGNYE